MPNIDLIPDVLYDGSHPYHYHFDNLPLKNIVIRQQIINAAVDIQNAILTEAKGTAGSLAARLDAALESDGTFSADSIDDTEHSIGAHTDGEYEGIEYVRMTQDERDKLALINDEATEFSIQIEDDVLSNGPVTFESSDTIDVELIEPATIKFNATFSTDSLRLRYYDVTPVNQDEVPDYTNYFANGLETPYVDGSLRVYINGIRLTADADVLVYAVDDGPSGSWTEISYEESASEGTFALTRAITESDIIRVDFDTEII